MIEKLADPQVVDPGGTVRFTLRISTAQGSTGVADVVVRDTVPSPLEVIDLASSRGDIIVQGREVVAFPATLAPGETVLITITARVPRDAAAGTVVNTATVTTSTPGDPPGDNTSSVTVQITPPDTPPPPRRLPRTADPDEPSLLMRLLPWGIVALLLVLLGGTLSIRHRGWPLIRVPERGIEAGEAAGPAAQEVLPPRPEGRVDAAPPAEPDRSPRLGPELPAARPPEALPPAPGTYRDERESDGA
jgi:uncharacterized repeat protein (TIGR01451 family)